MARQENTPLAWGWRIRAATDSAAGLAVPFTDFAPMWVNSHGHSCSTPDRHGDPPYSSRRLIKPPDTVGELKSAEIYVSDMPSLKAKKLGKLPQEEVLLEL
jgi:hypothetical protein